MDVFSLAAIKPSAGMTSLFPALAVVNGGVSYRCEASMDSKGLIFSRVILSRLKRGSREEKKPSRTIRLALGFYPRWENRTRIKSSWLHCSFHSFARKNSRPEKERKAGRGRKVETVSAGLFLFSSWFKIIGPKVYSIPFSRTQVGCASRTNRVFILQTVFGVHGFIRAPGVQTISAFSQMDY